MIILDSSAAIAAILPSQDPARRDAFRAALVDQPCISPALFLSETANALWKEVIHRGLAPDIAVELQSLCSATTQIVDDQPFVAEALRIGMEHAHPVYDCIFIAMGRTMGLPILTADKKLRRKFAQDQFVEVESL